MVPLKGQWQIIADRYLREIDTSNHKLYIAWDDYISRVQKNPLSFFLPHGAKRKDGTNDGLAFINDTENDLIILTAPEQTGKSIHGAAFICFRTLPCAKDWLCFTHHGVKHHEWKGPRQVIIASYSWDEVSTVWNTYKKIMPREILGPYSPNWGAFRGEHGNQKELTFGNATKRLKWHGCGTEFIFLSYVQSITHWTGKQADEVHLDEQADEEKVDQVTSRQRTRGGKDGPPPIICTLTGHQVKDRPDTGAAGWMKRKIIDRGITKGRKVALYKITIPSVPDAIMSKKAKEAARIQWVVEPKKFNDEKKIREAEAKYHGGWEVGGGLVLSEWNPDFHWISPFDIWKFKPTLYRMIDHGQNPCACGLFAVMPWGDTIMFQEYYVFGKNIYDNARGIVEMCGNEVIKAQWDDEGKILEEVFKKMDFRASEMDSRSFNKKADESNKPIGRVYNESGLFCTPASGKHDKAKDEHGLITLLKEALAVRPEEIHIDYRLGRARPPEKKSMGAPKFYIFNNCKNFRMEVETCIGKKNEADHLISVTKFAFATDRPYLGDYGVFEKKEEIRDEQGSSITGY
jgi:hypothetical protein